MPRPSKGARVYERKRAGRASAWVILDGSIERATGARNRREAEEELAHYIAERGRPSGCAAPEQMTVSQALSIYGEEHAVHAADPARIGYAIDALDSFWGGLHVADVKSATCRRYAMSRVRRTASGTEVAISPATVRRELGTLQAALNYCEREGYLTSAPRVTLPEKSPPRDRWLTRTEVAWMLRASRRLRIDGRHLARFIIAGIYTGTRKEAVLGLGIDMPSILHGWVDTDAGLLYRVGSGQRRTKKRQPTARLPRPFLGHLRRWKAMGCSWVVENCHGNRVGDIKHGWSHCISLAESMAAAAAEKSGDASRAICLSGVTPHTLRHTAITWAMQRGADKWEACGYFGVSIQVLEEVYAHHHPDHQGSAVRAMERGRT